jgi:Flp pilus assembly pilin Flp
MKQKMMRKARWGQSGQSTIEYTIVVAMAILILIEGGASAPVAEVMTNLKSAYQGFVYAISLASNLIAL